MGDNETERDGTVQSVITEQGDVNTYRFNTCFIKCEVSYSAAISCANINIYLAFLKLPRTNTHWHCCLASLFALVRTLKPRFFAILFLVKCLLHFHTFAFNCALCFLFLWILCCVALLLTWLIRLPNRWPQNETNKSGPQHTNAGLWLGKSKIQLLQARQACVHVGDSEQTELDSKRKKNWEMKSW